MDNSGSSDGPKNSIFRLTPYVGRVLIDIIGVGLVAGNKYSSTKTFEFDDESNQVELKDKTGTFVISPTVFYFMAFTDRIICLTNLAFGFGNVTNQCLGYNPDSNMDEVMSEEYKLNSIRASLRPSFLCFLNEYWRYHMNLEVCFNSNVSFVNSCIYILNPLINIGF